MDTASIERRLSSIERLLKTLVGEKKKATWVKAHDITGLTGWDNQKMRHMRQAGVIDFKKDKKGWWYDLNSIPPQFIKVPHENIFPLPYMGHKERSLPADDREASSAEQTKR
jgi:hypothetical protein